MKKALPIILSLALIAAFVAAVPEKAFASTIVDSFTNPDPNNYATFFYITADGQSFTGDGSVLDSAQFYLEKVGSPPGTAVARIYAHSGTFGTSGVPTGSPLATSDSFAPSSLTTSFQWTTFTFSGANKITLVSGTHYFLMLEYGSAVSTANSIRISDRSGPSATHNGNETYLHMGTPNVLPGNDAGFYVYGVSGGPPPSDTCTYSGSGDWNILGSDHCYITGNTYITGALNLIGAGWAGLAGTIAAHGIHASPGFLLYGLNGSARLYTR